MLSNRIKFTYSIILAFSIIGYVLRPLLFDGYDPLINFILFFVQFLFLTLIWESFRKLNHLLNLNYPYERSMTWRIVIQISIGAILMLIFRGTLQIAVEPQLPLRLDNMFRFSTYALFVFVSVVINLGYIADYFIVRWKESIKKAARLEQEKLQMQLNNLRNQLNPHFLFNALTSLNSLIFEDPKLASEFLYQLSRIYHYLLQHKDKSFVALSTELTFIDHYIGLLKTRFGNALHITLNISEDAMERAIVPVTLQSLIENALKHNVIQDGKPLKINISNTEDYLVISNNIQKKKNVENSNNQGLSNLITLYALLTDKPFIIKSEEKYFEVSIPLI
jgi:two-component system, LytTR family, sensor kinase